MEDVDASIQHNGTNIGQEETLESSPEPSDTRHVRFGPNEYYSPEPLPEGSPQRLPEGNPSPRAGPQPSGSGNVGAVAANTAENQGLADAGHASSTSLHAMKSLLRLSLRAPAYA